MPDYMENYLRDINKRIARLRDREGMTQLEFGEILAVSQQYVGALESGLRRPGLALIFMMAAKFEVTEDWLKNGEGKMPKQPAFHSAVV
jgi:transcriptional regulator with XRE-family HTH domain